MKDATLMDLSKQQLAENYAKLKARVKGSAITARREANAAVEDLLVVGTASGLGYLMGSYHAEAAEEAVKDGHAPGTDKYTEAVAEGGQLMGVDIDLIVGGVATGLGAFGLAGKMSNTIRKVGIGGLAAYGARIGYEKGEDSVTEADEEDE